MRRRLSTVLALVVFAVPAVWVAGPAGAQNDPAELDRLEAERDALTVELAEIDAQLGALAGELEELEGQLAGREVEIELVADEIEVTAWARQEPATTRLRIAIVGFTQGDPRRNELINEVRTLEGDDEPARRRALYESVIDDTTARLMAIDALLRDLAGELSSARAERDGTAVELADTQLERDEVGARRSEVAARRDQTVARIEELRALENRAVLTGLSTFDDPSRPALAVKIDNVRGAFPQAGINQADIVYVEEVEGGLTRLAAVFHSAGARVVGPVRSMRTGDFDLLAQLNGPLFANSGGNRGARAALAESTLVDVGVNAVSSTLYYRNPERRAPHNLFTDAFNLWSVGRDLPGAGPPAPIFPFRGAADGRPEGAEPVSSVSLDYGTTRVSYAWNGSSWDRSQDGAPTVDADGVRTSPTTVVVQFVEYRPSFADRASPEAVSVGSGEAWVLTDGHVVRGSWSRPDLRAPTNYVVAGTSNPIPILPGRTWIELVRPGRAGTS